MTDGSVVRMAHARLMGLKENIPESTAGEEFIVDFHDIIDDLGSKGVDLDKFRIPQSATATSGGWCDANFLKSKVQGLLYLFTVSEDQIFF